MKGYFSSAPQPIICSICTELQQRPGSCGQCSARFFISQLIFLTRLQCFIQRDEQIKQNDNTMVKLSHFKAFSPKYNEPKRRFLTFLCCCAGLRVINRDTDVGDNALRPILNLFLSWDCSTTTNQFNPKWSANEIIQS